MKSTSKEKGFAVKPHLRNHCYAGTPVLTQDCAVSCGFTGLTLQGLCSVQSTDRQQKYAFEYSFANPDPCCCLALAKFNVVQRVSAFKDLLAA